MADNKRNNSRKAPPKIRIPVSKPMRMPVSDEDPTYNYWKFMSEPQPATPLFSPMSKQANINRTHAYARRLSNQRVAATAATAATAAAASRTFMKILGERGVDDIAKEVAASRSYFREPKPLRANASGWVPSYVVVEEALAAAAAPRGLFAQWVHNKQSGNTRKTPKKE